MEVPLYINTSMHHTDTLAIMTFIFSLDNLNQLEIIENEDRQHRFTAKERNDISIKFITNDPGDAHFLDFYITKGDSVIGRYGAIDLYSLQMFVTSLGGKCHETTVKKWKSKKTANRGKDSREETLASAGDIFSNPATIKLQAYSKVLSCLSASFYYTEPNSFTISEDYVRACTIPGSVLPIYDPSISPSPFLKRAMHDTFRPPKGNKAPFLYSLGYGMEVGLQERLQEVCMANSKSSIVIDHNRCKIISTKQVSRSNLALPHVDIKWKYIHDSQIENVEDLFQNDTSCSNYLDGSSPLTCSPELLDNYDIIENRLDVSGRDLEGLSAEFHYDKHCSGSGGCFKHKNGKNGKNGRTGFDGANGEPGPTVKMILKKSKQSLYIHGPEKLVTSGNFSTLEGEQVILINCRGGSGGDGAEGSCGGEGGDGGDGSKYYNDKEDNNADGGQGGNGGDGGDGGDGGRGGDGGNCVIEAADSTLFKLIEVDCRGGKPGRGGDNGTGGKKGKGGASGRGGLHGDDGEDGKDGSPGKAGDTSRNGCIMWVVTSADGQNLLQSSTRYNATVVGYDVVPVFDDGILEPNEKITISGIMIKNTGGLPLPAGSIACMPSTAEVKFEPLTQVVPELEPGGMCRLPVDFHGRICDIPPPNTPRVYKKMVEVHPRIELLGRPFANTLYKKELCIQYPLQLLKVDCPTQLQRGEISTIKIGIKNHSQVCYGCFKGSSGSVFLNLHFHARIRPLGAVADSPDYNISYDPHLRDSTYVTVMEIPPGKTLTIEVAIQMENHMNASEECIFQVDLYLRKKLIQYKQKIICATVNLNYDVQNPPADVLLVSNKDCTSKEFQFWGEIFNILDVSVDYWDIVQHKGLSVDVYTKTRHENSWAGRYTGKMILFPHCNIKFLHGEDIATHFHGPQAIVSDSSQDLGSSLVLFMPEKKSIHQQNAVLKHIALAAPKVEIPSSELSRKHLCQPSMEIVRRTFTAWEANYMHSLEVQKPSQSLVLLEKKVSATKVGFCRYSYGSADIRRLPILRSSKFLLIDGNAGDKVAMAVSDKCASDPTKIPLTTNRGQVLLATLYGIPMSAKLRLLKSQSNFSFHVLSKLSLSLDELAMIAVAWEIADELYSYSSELHRINELYNDIRDNSDDYIANGRTVLSGLKLITKETEKRSSGGKMINSFIKKIEDIIAQMGVNVTDIPDLPSLEILHLWQSFHYCHQHFINEKQWDLCEK